MTWGPLGTSRRNLLRCKRPKRKIEIPILTIRQTLMGKDHFLLLLLSIHICRRMIDIQNRPFLFSRLFSSSEEVSVDLFSVLELSSTFQRHFFSSYSFYGIFSASLIDYVKLKVSRYGLRRRLRYVAEWITRVQSTIPMRSKHNKQRSFRRVKSNFGRFSSFKCLRSLVTSFCSTIFSFNGI